VRRPAVLLALFAIAAAACSGPLGAPAATVTPDARPVLTSPPAAAPTPNVVARPASTTCADAQASLRPDGPLPKAGSLPANSFMRSVADRGKLVVGVSQDTPPFGYLNPFDNQIEGFDIDLSRLVAKAIFGDDGHIEFHVIDPAQRIWQLRDGTLDMVARTFEITCNSRKQVEFSTTYFDSGQRLLVGKSTNFQSLQDLAGKKVCAAFGTTSLDNVLDAPSRPLVTAGRDWTDCLVLFQQGQVDAISGDEVILNGLAAQDQSTRVVGAKFFDQPYGLGVSQAHPEFVRFVNAVLEKARTDGTWAAMYNKWLHTGPAPAPPAAAYRD
jgi:polar amino acid transport system substrate-binding protein